MLLDLIGATLLGFNAAIVIGAFALGLGTTPGAKFRTAAILAGWLAIVIALGATGVLYAAPTAPQALQTAAIAKFGIAAALPIVAIVTATLSFTSLKERVLNLPLTMLVGVNSIRVLGVLFLVLYGAGRLPAPFAQAAGWGDIIVGALAIPLALATRRYENRVLLIGWSALGLADLVNALALGVTTSLNSLPGSVGMGPMTLLPWLLIPAFLVPLFFVSHLAVLYKVLRPRPASHRPAFA